MLHLSKNHLKACVLYTFFVWLVDSDGSAGKKRPLVHLPCVSHCFHFGRLSGLFTRSRASETSVPSYGMKNMHLRAHTTRIRV